MHSGQRQAGLPQQNIKQRTEIQLTLKQDTRKPQGRIAGSKKNLTLS